MTEVFSSPGERHPPPTTWVAEPRGDKCCEQEKRLDDSSRVKSSYAAGTVLDDKNIDTHNPGSLDKPLPLPLCVHM